MNKRLILFFLLAFWLTSVHGQETTEFTNAYQSYKKGMELFDKGIHGAAMSSFKETMALLRPVNHPESDLLMMKARLHYAKSAIRLEMPDGEKLMLDFIRTYQPDPIANQALMELADYYFNDRKYEKAVEYYEMVPSYQLSGNDRSELMFKTGYAYFVQKEFRQAKAKFYPIRSMLGSDYYYPANYYYGLCEFFEGNYSDAIKSFRLVEGYPKYRSHIPYYVTQIYFHEGKFDELIAYAEPKLNDSGLRNEAEIHQLVGQAYFENGNYSKALPHLEYYGNHNRRLREEEFYQLGFTQHKTGNHESAVSNLEQLSSVDHKLGQHAMFILGKSYLELGNKSAARNAFGLAAAMTYDDALSEDANFNYAKLSYELNFPSDALSALQEIGPESAYYAESQELMSELFLGSRDYENALKIIEAMPNKTPRIRETYQQVAYFRGLQLLRDEQPEEARNLFSTSLEVPVNIRFKALANFWLGKLAYDEDRYDLSIQRLNQFLTSAKTLNDLPAESSVHTANYLLGYNYLKQKKYTTAQGYFQDCVAGIKRNTAIMDNSFVEYNILGDAVLRAGDCLFKRNKYDEAIRFYDEAIKGNYSGFVYAIYQKAVIEGLRGRRTEQILAFERIVEEYGNSEYADDALLQLGQIYQQINRLSEATVPLKKLVNNYRNNSDLVNEALIQLGLISYNQGSLELALNYYKQVFENNPTSKEAAEALKAIEEIYIRDLSQPDAYFAFLETIPGYDLDDYARDSINFRAAESQYENGNYDKAISGFTAYITKFPNGRNRLVAQQHRGESHMVLKDYSNALKDFEYVVSRGPSKYYLRAIENAALIAYNHEEDFTKSYNYFSLLERNAASEQERFEAQLGALRSAYRLDNSEAVYELANKVAGNPNATQEQRTTATFYIGKILFDRKDYANALQAFGEVISESDNELAAEARYLTAYIYYVQRDLDLALQICERANKESSGYPYWVAKSVILMSDIYAERDDLWSARAILEALLEKYNGDPELIRIARAKKEQYDKQLQARSRLEKEPDTGTLELDEGN